MLYKKSSRKDLTKELFLNPTSEYRGTPFWAWNCKLDKEMFLKQIGQIKEMGMGGVHIHCRTGLATEYLGEEFMGTVKACNEKLKEEDMLCWLYDEDRWPSGFAGGLVTKDDKYRSRFLIFTPKAYEEKAKETLEIYDSSGRAQRSDNRTLLGRYEIVLKNGYLDYFKRLAEGEFVSKGGKLWWAYLEVSGNNPWFNNQAYVNTLDKEAINKFIETTHEKYYKELGEEFGKSIPAIFTDEPQFTHKESLGYAEEERDIALPYTDDFEETYKKAYGNSFLDFLPELLWELPQDKISIARYQYHDHLSERFTTAFSDNLGNWCETHNIMLTGHMMEEPTLGSQTRALGEAMRSYRSFQLPGIDMLCDRREFSTAKQAQSAANQYGRAGVISEIYGVTNWDFDFRGHKLAGDWQAALGVTVRVHHLTWASMGGEAKRDYPAAIGYQSPWYKEYPLIEDHFSRLNTALTRGKPHVKIAVIHPVESYWLHFGPIEQTSIIREELETNFNNLTEWLLFGMLDFHFISESLFKDQCEIKESSFLKVGEMEYDVILVPGNETLRTTTLERLEAFSKGGGTVIFIGEPAQLVDAVKSDRAINLAKSCNCIPFAKSRVLQALDYNREIDIRKKDGTRSDNLIYQMRVDGQNKWLFICHVNRMNNPDISLIENVSIKIKGNFIPTIYDTLTGEIRPCSAVLKGSETWISHEFSEHDSLLLCLKPGIPQLYLGKDTNKGYKEIRMEDPVSISLSEPNVLLLDMAEYSFDKSEWMEKEEVLRIDNLFRRKLGYPLRMDAMAQPWVNSTEEAFEHTLSLKFIITSDIEIKEPVLALEDAENTILIINGTKIATKIVGWFVDECIKKVQLPSLPKGESEIIMKIPFNSKTNVEWSYLLGDFGVKVNGSHATIIDPVKRLSFGDWTNQGLPFYAGNVTYHCEVLCEKGELNIETPQFRNPLLSVSLDDKKAEQIAFAPYKLNLGQVGNGIHNVDITAFGNRINAFGTLHNCNKTTTWYGPNAWRTIENNWAYEYQLKPTGILIKPRITLRY
ncbi:MAG: hypothetical protein H7Y18_00285 [Clostridiaceae bacterium]|nr:hypothetical protein [Clostridiaceae bacterium]